MVARTRIRVKVTSCRVKDSWLALALDGRCRIFANSLPNQDKHASISSVLRNLRLRGVESFYTDAPDTDGVAEGIARSILAGGGRVELAFDGLSELQRATLQLVMGIPKGSVTSYGDIASALGKPRLARSVGAVMKRNPFPLVVPCHRVVRSDMTLGGFSYGVGLKEALLAMEGVEVVNGKVRERHRLAQGRLSCRSWICP